MRHVHMGEGGVGWHNRPAGADGHAGGRPRPYGPRAFVSSGKA